MTRPTVTTFASSGLPRVGDDYTNYLNVGSAGDMARQEGGANLPVRVLEEHQSYDDFCQAGALDKLNC